MKKRNIDSFYNKLNPGNNHFELPKSINPVPTKMPVDNIALIGINDPKNFRVQNKISSHSKKEALLPENSYPSEHIQLNNSKNHKTFRPKLTNTNTKIRPVISRQKIVFSMACILFILGLSVSIQGFNSNKRVVEQLKPQKVSALSSSSSSEKSENTPSSADQNTPTEDPVTSYMLNNYTVSPEDPRYLYIPKFDIKSRIKQVGIDKDGALSVPQNIFDTGWYTGSSRPGNTSGASLIDGHVGGATTNGVFYKLKNLSNGDQIIIEKGNGQKITYKLIAKEIMPKDSVDMNKALRSIDNTKAGLNLITCTGKYLPKEKTYDQRLIVYLLQN